jgi:hypothetical protein
MLTAFFDAIFSARPWSWKHQTAANFPAAALDSARLPPDERPNSL